MGRRKAGRGGQGGGGGGGKKGDNNLSGVAILKGCMKPKQSQFCETIIST